MENCTKTVYDLITKEEFESMTNQKFSMELIEKLVNDDDYFQDMQETEVFQFEIDNNKYSYDKYLDELEVEYEVIEANYLN